MREGSRSRRRAASSQVASSCSWRSRPCSSSCSWSSGRRTNSIPSCPRRPASSGQPRAAPPAGWRYTSPVTGSRSSACCGPKSSGSSAMATAPPWLTWMLPATLAACSSPKGVCGAEGCASSCCCARGWCAATSCCSSAATAAPAGGGAAAAAPAFPKASLSAEGALVILATGVLEAEEEVELTSTMLGCWLLASGASRLATGALLGSTPAAASAAAAAASSASSGAAIES
jgi:hypothetical protein